MVKKWSIAILGILFLLLGVSMLFTLSDRGYIEMKGTIQRGTSALIIIGAHIFIGIFSLLTLFRKYTSYKKLGYVPIDSGNHIINEAFQRDYDHFTLTFYSWRNFTVRDRAPDWGYQGLYMTMDYDGDCPREADLIKGFFDKYEKKGNTIVFFKDGWFIDNEDCPNLIRRIHNTLGISNHRFIKKFPFKRFTQRHHLTTELDFGKYLDRSKLSIMVEKLFFILPQIALVFAINIFFTTELGALVGSKTTFANNMMAGLITIIIGLWHFYWAKYWSLSKGMSKKSLKVLFEQEKTKSILGIVFVLIGIFKILGTWAM